MKHEYGPVLSSVFCWAYEGQTLSGGYGGPKQKSPSLVRDGRNLTKLGLITLAGAARRTLRTNRSLLRSLGFASHLLRWFAFFTLLSVVSAICIET